MLELIVHCVACAVIGGVGSRIINVARRGLRRHRPRLTLLAAPPVSAAQPSTDVSIDRTIALWGELLDKRERARNTCRHSGVSSLHEREKE